MKRLLLVLIICLSFLSAHAQHFDWVKSYWGIATNGGQADGNKIIGTDVDSDGNVYVIGEFTSGAQINGVDLLPMNPYGIQNKTINVVIAKLSPEGDLLWHKAIHSNGGCDTRAIGIQCVGDSSLVCMAQCNLPTADNYTFFLDTLLTDWESASYLMETDSIMGAAMTSVLQFSLDGQLNNRHFLSISYIDSSGQDITGDRLFADAAMYASRYVNSTLPVTCFAIDDNGNFIISRQATDRMFLYCDTCMGSRTEWSASNGLIKGLKILIDGGVKQLVYQIPSPTSNNNCQILKFSPHFDSLIAAAYYFLMQPNDMVVDRISFYRFHSIKTDRKGRVYVTGTIMVDTEYRDAFNLAIPNSDDMALAVEESNNTTGFLIQYDSQLAPQRIAQLRGVNNYSQFYMNSVFHCINFDEDSNVVILIDVGKTTDDLNDGRYFLYDSTRLDVGFTTCFLRIDTAWNYISSGQINSQVHTELSKRTNQYDIAVKNNRIMAQVRYFHNLATMDSTYTTSMRSHGLITWDYDGHCISFIDYHSPSPNTEMGGTILRDSVLYLSGTFQDGATLQDFSVPSDGYYNAYIAKYVNAAYLSPYIYIEHRNENIITWNQELNYTVNESPVILNAIASSGLPILYTVSDTSIATVDGDVLTLLREGSCNIVASQPGNNYYLPAIPIEKTLVVEHTGINQISNHTFNVYPNPTNGTVVINTDGESISSVYLMTSVGQWNRMAVNGNLISLEGFPSGVYYLQVITDKNIYKQKIIKL